ncbi:MAG: hypothetical protein JXB62_18255 [Pirellulales bacterium]|nr:hypothetical protein [Pirellulales bacterium]
MAEAFDPYLTWLGIRDPQRPPNHYRLLGVALFEDDPRVLEHAADRQMAHVRTFQTGRHSAQSQRLLNELATAKLCLLNAEKKAAYDARLRAQRQAESDRAAAAPTPAEPATPPPLPKRAQTAAPREPIEPAGSPLASCLLAMLVAMVLTLGGLIAIATMRGGLNIGGPDATETAAGGRPGDAGPGAATPSPAPSVPNRSQPRPAQPDASLPGPSQPQQGNQDGTESPPTDPDGTDAEGTAPDGSGPESRAPEGSGLPEQHLAVPSGEVQEATRREVRRLFEAEYRQAAESPAARRALAAMLLRKAVDTQDDPVARYVLLIEARDVAVAVGEPDVLLQAVETLGAEYEVPWLLMATETICKSARLAREPEANNRLAAAALLLAGQAAAREEFDSAALLADAARDMARNLQAPASQRDAKLLDRAVRMIRNVAAWQQQRQAFLAAEGVLVRQPDDPAANLAAGEYHCFVQGNFELGLPELARGNDAELRELAEAELAEPAETAEMLALADRWWTASEPLTDPARHCYQLRATFWYQQALPELTGLSRTRAQRRLEQLRQEGDTSAGR